MIFRYKSMDSFYYWHFVDFNVLKVNCKTSLIKEKSPAIYQKGVSSVFIFEFTRFSYPSFGMVVDDVNTHIYDQ